MAGSPPGYRSTSPRARAPEAVRNYESNTGPRASGPQCGRPRPIAVVHPAVRRSAGDAAPRGAGRSQLSDALALSAMSVWAASTRLGRWRPNCGLSRPSWWRTTFLRRDEDREFCLSVCAWRPEKADDPLDEVCGRPSTSATMPSPWLEEAVTTPDFVEADPRHPERRSELS